MAVLGSPTIQMLISPLRFVFSVVTLGTPPNNMRRTPRLTSSFPAKRKSCLRAMIFRQRIERNGLYAPGKFTAQLKKDNTNNHHIPSRAVTKISSCWVNTTSRPGIKQLGFLLVLFFFYFPMKVAGDNVLSSRGISPAPAS